MPSEIRRIADFARRLIRACSRPSNPMNANEAQHRVLLIDDDELISGSLRQYLGENGYAVDAAHDRTSSELLMAAHSYAAVLLDPYLTGGVCANGNSELLRRVCAMQPHAAMLVLTAYGSPALARTVAECNVRILPKPQSVVFLERLIRGAIASRLGAGALDAAPLSPARGF
jgi:DNA-binding NarL/FixJ family response regulator